MAELPDILTPEQFAELGGVSDMPDVLTPEQFSALGGVSAGQDETPQAELATGETFGRGIADMLGGRYIMPAIAGGVSKLAGDERPFSEIYSDAQQYWDEPQDFSRQVGQAVGLMLPMSAGGKAAMAVPGISKAVTGVQTLGGLGQAGGIGGAAARLAGSTLAGAGTGAISGLVATPYANLMQGRGTTGQELLESGLQGGAFGAGFGAAGGAVSGIRDWYRRGTGKYQAPGLSSSYGEGFGKEAIDKSGIGPDVKMVQSVKHGIYPSTKEFLESVVSSMPEGKPLIKSAINNEKQRDIVTGAVLAMKGAHPGTANKFISDVIQPELKTATSKLNTSIKAQTGNIGTPKYLNDRADELDRLYKRGISQLKGINFSEDHVRKALSGNVGETLANNVIADIQSVKSSSPYLKGTGSITGADIAAYLRKNGKIHDVLNFEDAAKVTDTLESMLAREGNVDFLQGYKGWREWYGIKKAFESGKKIANSSRNVDDILSSIKPTSHSGIDPNLEVQAKTSGFLDNIRETMDSNNQVFLKTSAEEALEYYPGLSEAIKTYNYWKALDNISKGIGIGINSRLNPFQRGVSKLAWSPSAMASGVIEEALRGINKKVPEKSAEALARLLNANKSDWSAIINATYRKDPGALLKGLPTVIPVGRAVFKEEER